MLRDRRLPHLNNSDDLAYRKRAPFTREQIQNLQPRWIRQAPEPTCEQLCVATSDHRQSTIADKNRARKPANVPGLVADSPQETAKPIDTSTPSTRQYTANGISVFVSKYFIRNLMLK